MKGIFAILIVIVMVFTVMVQPVYAAKKSNKHKPVKVVGKMVHCPYCITGKSSDCPYWFIDIDGTGRHMSNDEIAEFEWVESHYQTDDGEWHVK